MSNDYSESMSLNFHRMAGGDMTSITVTLDDATFLCDALDKFAEFLRAAGFTYVDSIVAVTEDGDEITSVSDAYGEVTED